jgi:hypothetical protein
VLAASADGAIALTITLSDAETGEDLGGTDLPSFLALADWDPETGEGWASTRTLFMQESPTAEACAFDGALLHVHAEVCDFEGACGSLDEDVLATFPAENCAG